MARYLQLCGQLISLSDMQVLDSRYRMVDTGVRLQHRGLFTLSTITGIERLHCAYCVLDAGNPQQWLEAG